MMKARYLIPFAVAVSFWIFLGCATVPSDLSVTAIIPKPVSMTPTGMWFSLTRHSDIFIPDGTEEMIRVGNYLADCLNPPTGLGLEVIADGGRPGRGDIILELGESDADLGEEGYELGITDRTIKITANTPRGVFYGVQTLRQIFPPAIESDVFQDQDWAIPTGTIRDYPVYEYRGAMRDVARHFFGPEEIKTFIDQMAFYKMNVLHLHLSDDQGWRIEIKSWPNLALYGGKTEVGGGEGGYYTQEEYSDIVSYALDRYITVIPEIDMPGHTNAALASYPELNESRKSPDLYTGIKVGFSTLDTRSETTYRFVEDVIRELAALTPGEYIHIGGDESHVTKKDDYIYFINRVQDIVAPYGKKVLGWDEIALSSLKPGTVVQYWARSENAVLGVRQGAKVLMSPARYAYLDMKYDSTSTFGLKWAGFIEVDKGYSWDPASLVPEITRGNIVGIEAPLWSETVSTMAEAEYLLFPRLPGYAEIGWTPSELRAWDEYKIRLAEHGKRMKILGISFFPSKMVNWEMF